LLEPVQEQVTDPTPQRSDSAGQGELVKGCRMMLPNAQGDQVAHVVGHLVH